MLEFLTHSECAVCVIDWEVVESVLHFIGIISGNRLSGIWIKNGNRAIQHTIQYAHSLIVQPLPDITLIEDDHGSHRKVDIHLTSDKEPSTFSDDIRRFIGTRPTRENDGIDHTCQITLYQPSYIYLRKLCIVRIRSKHITIEVRVDVIDSTENLDRPSIEDRLSLLSITTSIDVCDFVPTNPRLQSSQFSGKRDRLRMHRIDRRIDILRIDENPRASVSWAFLDSKLHPLLPIKPGRQLVTFE